MANAEKTLAEMRKFRSDLWDVKAALNEAATAATSSNYTAQIKSLQGGIDFEIFAIDNLIGSLSKLLEERNWPVLDQQLEKYQQQLQQAKDKVCDAKSLLAAVERNNIAKVSITGVAAALAHW